MIFSSTSVIAEVYAGARSDATAHAAHAGASRFPRAAIGLTWQVRSLASGLGVALAKLDTGWTGCSRRSASPGTRAGGRGMRRWVGRSGMPELLPELMPELMPIGSQRSLPARGFRDVMAIGPYA